MRRALDCAPPGTCPHRPPLGGGTPTCAYIPPKCAYTTGMNRPATTSRRQQAAAVTVTELDITLITARLNQMAHARQRRVAGLMGRYFVRAGMHPLWATERNRDTLVQALLRGHLLSTADLTYAERADVAVAAVRGWVAGRG